jgi:hypothetical protein
MATVKIKVDLKPEVVYVIDNADAEGLRMLVGRLEQLNNREIADEE